MDAYVAVVFVGVYLGMMLGRWPGLALDRTGIALLGAIALLAGGRMDAEAARNAVHVPTLGLLFGLMVVSAQFRLAGFYTAVTRRIAIRDVHPDALLALIIVTSGVLSAVLANDIVCLAVAPLVVEGCARRGLRPVPFLLALACASNVGSAATLIGNPQNMLIGQRLGMSFGGYLLDGAVPAAAGLVAVWCVVRRGVGESWHGETPVPAVAAPSLNPWQCAKGLAILAGVMALFVFTEVPREVAALGAAGLILMSRRMESRDMLALVDWHLLVLFVGLFIVNAALESSGMLANLLRAAESRGPDPHHPAALFALAALLSNLVSNVPAVMLLLPAAVHPAAGAVLALSSTLAGNLFIVGSIANIIVVDQARRLGVRIGWLEHARVGVPVTLLTLAGAAAWLWIRSL